MSGLKVGVSQVDLSGVSLEKFVRHLMLCLMAGISQADLPGVISEKFVIHARSEGGYKLGRPTECYFREVCKADHARS